LHVKLFNIIDRTSLSLDKDLFAANISRSVLESISWLDYPVITRLLLPGILPIILGDLPGQIPT